MQQSAFSKPGRFWRGNTHTHSTLSDGVLEPGEVCRRYAEAGYDFLSLTDHFVGMYGYPVAPTREYRTNSFTTIPGAEVHSGALGNGELWHMVAVGLPEDFEPPDCPDFRVRDGMESAASLATRAAEAGAFVSVAHPEWFGMTVDDARVIEAAHAVEIYNHGCAVECDRGRGIAVWDGLLGDGRRLSGCATDDAHFKGPDHFGGWVMVKAEANEPEALVAAMIAGDYYSSMGPKLHQVAIDGDHLVIECSEVRHIIACGRGSASAHAHAGGKLLTSARLPLHRFAGSGWVRAIVIDAEGKRAWANPIWLD